MTKLSKIGTQPTNNTDASTIMISEKAADLIKASRTRQTVTTSYQQR